MGYVSSMGSFALAEERTYRRVDDIVAWKAFHGKGFVIPRRFSSEASHQVPIGGSAVAQRARRELDVTSTKSATAE